MNDYADTSHQAIYAMVKAGQPGQVDGYAATLNGIRNQLGGHVAGLREQLDQIAVVWSDEAGSERLTADLAAVVDYLDTLAAGLSGQSSSYSNLVTQAAADLAVAQTPAELPPPPLPGKDIGSLQSARERSVAAASMNPAAAAIVVPAVQSGYDVQIAAAEAAQQLAGQTATTLDSNYRTVLARLTPPPEPPPTVSDAGGTGPVAAAGTGGSDPGSGTPVGGWAGAGGGSAGAGAAGVGAAAAVNQAGWSTPAGSVAGMTGAGLVSPAAGSVAAGQTGVDTGWSANGSPTVAVGAAGSGGPTGDGWAAAVRPAAMSGLRTDPTAATGGIWAAAGSAAGSGPSSSAQNLGVHGVGSDAGFAGDRGFDPVTGAPVTSGAVGLRTEPATGGSSWETAAGVGGLAALTAGGMYLARGGAAVGGLAAVGGVGVAGLAGAGPGGVGGFGQPGSAGVGGFGQTGPGGVSGGGVGGVGSGPGGVGGAGSGSATTAGSAGIARGVGPGSVGSNSMVQGGQIGQAGRPTPGSAGYGAGRPAAPGSVIGGGQQDYRVTWLVEDRDLYGIGPSVAAVIEVPVEPV